MSTVLTEHRKSTQHRWGVTDALFFASFYTVMIVTIFWTGAMTLGWGNKHGDMFLITMSYLTIALGIFGIIAMCWTVLRIGKRIEEQEKEEKHE